MWNKRKTLGIIAGAAGIFFARIDFFFQLEKTVFFGLYAFGILLALAGLAIYASGMPSSMKRFKACSACYTKNEAAAAVCKKCKQIFPGPAAQEKVL
jgi:hypothetical protein